MRSERSGMRTDVMGRAIARALTGTLLGDRWFIEGLIGIGGTAVVLGATDGPDGTPAVAKIISPMSAAVVDSDVRHDPREPSDRDDLQARWARFVRESRREAKALRRLAQRRPPCPYVVRLYDEGEIELPLSGVPLVELQAHAYAQDAGLARDADVEERIRQSGTISLRYLILEYVDGGELGTTLHERIHASLAEGGRGFPPPRARRLLRHVARALEEIHAEGLVHRDLKPSNVLVAGPPDDEIAKVTDFGIVGRSAGRAPPEHAAHERGEAADAHGDAARRVAAVSVGYSAPEQYLPGNALVGPHTDVFSFGALAYEVLTGCALFPHTARAALAAARRSHRHSLLDAPTIDPRYSRDPGAARAIDVALARATSPRIDDRPSDVREIWGVLDRALEALDAAAAGDVARKSHSPPSRDGRYRMGATAPSSPPRANDRTAEPAPAWHWRIRGRDLGPDAIRCLVASEDGKALAVGRAGARYWDGSEWLELDAPRGVARDAFHCVARIDPDRFVLAGHGGLFAHLARGSWSIMRGPDSDVGFTALWGDERGALVAAATRPGRSAVLWSASGGQWHAAQKLPGIARVDSLAAVGSGRVVAAAERISGVASEAAAATEPTMFRTWPRGALISIGLVDDRVRDVAPDFLLPSPLVVAASRLGELVAVGPAGFAASGAAVPSGFAFRREWVDTSCTLTGARFDHYDRAWCVAGGRILERVPDEAAGAAWRAVWRGTDDGLSLAWVLPERGRILAFGRDGLVLEGRASERVTRSQPPEDPRAT